MLKNFTFNFKTILIFTRIESGSESDIAKIRIAALTWKDKCLNALFKILSTSHYFIQEHKGHDN